MSGPNCAPYRVMSVPTSCIRYGFRHDLATRRSHGSARIDLRVPDQKADDEGHGLDHAQLQQAAKDHLWMHFTGTAPTDADVPVIVRGEGAYIYDDHGKRYLDALAGLFVSQLGHGRTDLAEAAAKQAQELAFMPLWSYAHPQRDRARRAGRRPMRPATSTGSSSPAAAARPSRPRGSWPRTTSS